MGDNAVKKIIKIIVPLVLIFVCVTGAFAQGTLSEEILNQAKREAGLFLELKSALGLDWLDEYNAYLENPTSNPEPSWDLSVADLVNGGYLSDSFPSDFTITKAGQEVKISKIITSQAMKDVLPIYLPSVTIAGDVVSLIVQRPEQWVAWQAGLLGKVSRDGSDNPDILPNAVLDFGKGSEIRFINNDGKLVGINSLTYKGQELEDRFVNAAGDNMTGPLKINGNIVWHAGNDGTGSGLDADLLDGKDSTYFTNAGNLASGIVPVARLSGTYNIDISGNAATATKLATARTISLTGDASGSASFDGSSNISINTNVSYSSNSDKLDGYHASDFVKKAGDTMTGPLGVNFENGISSGIGSHSIRGTGPADVVGKGFKIDWDTDFGFVGLVDKGADRKDMVFANEQTGDNFVFMSQGMEIMALKPASKTLEIGGNKVWHAGNDGTGSGLDADLLDGKHASGFLEQPIRLPANTDLNNIMTPGMYYTPLNVDAKTMANRPTDYAFSLLVEKHAGVKQTLTEYLPNNLARTWFRNYYNGTWGPWIGSSQVVIKQKAINTTINMGAFVEQKDYLSIPSYYPPIRRAPGSKTWYSFEEFTQRFAPGLFNIPGVEDLLSINISVYCDYIWAPWDVGKISYQVYEKDPNTGAVITLVNTNISYDTYPKSKPFTYTIRKGYQYGIDARVIKNGGSVFYHYVSKYTYLYAGSQ